MSEDRFKKIEIILPSTIVKQLYKISKNENRTVNQEIALIIVKYLKEYNTILEVTNEEDFGVITEEKLREFLSKEKNQIEYKYDEIKDYSFDQLFNIWVNYFL